MGSLFFSYSPSREKRVKAVTWESFLLAFLMKLTSKGYIRVTSWVGRHEALRESLTGLAEKIVTMDHNPKTIELRANKIQWN